MPPKPNSSIEALIDNEHFQGDREAYLANLETHNDLPPQLEYFRHKLNWPFNVEKTCPHITCHYGSQQNYSDPKPSEHQHLAVDIQLPLETEIIAPDNELTVVFNSANMPINCSRGLSDIMLYSAKTGIIYHLVHLDTNSLPSQIKRRTWFDRDSDTKLDAGDQIGTVGDFYGRCEDKNGLHPAIKVPPDVQREYGRSYNHIHIETHWCPNLQDVSLNYHSPFNPLTLFKKLYY